MDAALTARPFVDDDASALTELLHTAYAPLGSLGLNYTAVDQDEATTLRRAQAGQCWVVHDGRNGRLAATLTMSLPPSADLQDLTAEARAPRRAWLNQVAVHPDSQRSGLASHLWSLALGWADLTGATSVGVDTAVPADHLVRLYTTWGFTHQDVIHWPGKTYDSVVMTRLLHRTAA